MYAQHKRGKGALQAALATFFGLGEYGRRYHLQTISLHSDGIFMAPRLPKTIQRPGALVTSFAIALCVPVAQAQSDKSMKNLAVAGGLLSYAYAYSLDSNWDCQDQYRLGAQVSQDEELRSAGIQFSMFNCDNTDATPIPGLGIQFAPVFAATKWRANAGPYARTNEEFTVTPQIRYVYPLNSLAFDVGFGVGLSLISEPDIGTRQKSTRYQFSDEFSVGLSDRNGRYRLAYLYRHVSNADIKLPNNGVDFHGLSFSIALH